MSIATGAKTPSQSGYNVVQTPRMSPEVMQLVEQLRGQIQPGALSSAQQLSQLASGGTPEMWQQLESPALRQFQQLQGSISSRFSGMGSGARRSSGFQNTLGGAGADLAERLQANRMGLQQNAQQQLMQLYMQLMNMDPYEMMLMEKKKGWGARAGGALSGGGKGAAAGALVGSVIPGIGTGVGAGVGGGIGFLSGLFD